MKRQVGDRLLAFNAMWLWCPVSQSINATNQVGCRKNKHPISFIHIFVAQIYLTAFVVV